MNDSKNSEDWLEPLETALANMTGGRYGKWEPDCAVYFYDGSPHQSRAIYYHPHSALVVEVVESPDTLGGECIPNPADWMGIVLLRNMAPKLIDEIRSLQARGGRT